MHAKLQKKSISALKLLHKTYKKTPKDQTITGGRNKKSGINAQKKSQRKLKLTTAIVVFFMSYSHKKKLTNTEQSLQKMLTKKSRQKQKNKPTVVKGTYEIKKKRNMNVSITQ